MGIDRRRALISALLAGCAACTSSSDTGVAPDAAGTSSPAADGSPCSDGITCMSTFCVIKSGPEAVGECAPRPFSCRSCTTAPEKCTVAIVCSSPNPRCGSLDTAVTVACNQPLRAALQSCSEVVPCGEGLYCDIPDATKAGTCKMLPAQCDGDPCGPAGCLTALLQCSGVPLCTSSSNGAFIKCKR